jgi:hypothetical protein
MISEYSITTAHRDGRNHTDDEGGNLHQEGRHYVGTLGRPGSCCPTQELNYATAIISGQIEVPDVLVKTDP